MVLVPLKARLMMLFAGGGKKWGRKWEVAMENNSVAGLRGGISTVGTYVVQYNLFC